MSASYEELLERYLQAHPYPPLHDDDLHDQLCELSEAMADDSDPCRTSGAYGCERPTSSEVCGWRSFQIALIESMEPAQWPVAWQSTTTPSGGDNFNAIFTNAEACEIREAYATGMHTTIQLGDMFGAHKETIRCIVTGTTYRDAGGPITHCGRGNNPPSKRAAS